MIPLGYFLIIGAILFGLGFAGIIINRKNLIVLLMCIELMLLAVNTNFIAFSQYLGARGGGNICIFYFNSGRCGIGDRVSNFSFILPPARQY